MQGLASGMRTQGLDYHIVGASIDKYTQEVCVCVRVCKCVRMWVYLYA